MLETFLAQALASPRLARQFFQGELDRLQEQGYLEGASLERVEAELASALADLEASSAKTRTRAAGLLSGAGGLLGPLVSGVREALDLPSRAEVLALTKALRESAAAAGADPSAPPAGDAAERAEEA